MSGAMRVVCSTLCLILSACTAEYAADVAATSLERVRLKSHFKVERRVTWTVPAATRVYLAPPEDLRPGPRHRNIRALRRSLDLALRQAFPAYDTINAAATLKQALEAAARGGGDLLFLPKLVVAQNNLNSEREIAEGRPLHPTASYAPDRTFFQVLIYEVRSGLLLDVANVSGRGRMFAPDGELPLDLYRAAAREYVYAITADRVG